MITVKPKVISNTDNRMKNRFNEKHRQRPRTRENEIKLLLTVSYRNKFSYYSKQTHGDIATVSNCCKTETKVSQDDPQLKCL